MIRPVMSRQVSSVIALSGGRRHIHALPPSASGALSFVKLSPGHENTTGLVGKVNQCPVRDLSCQGPTVSSWNRADVWGRYS